MTERQTRRSALIESDRIEGTPVYSEEGRQIGVVKRLVIDQASGRVVYLVMTLAGALGLGDATYVMPWTKLSYDTRDGAYHTAITEAQLRSAPAAAQGDLDWTESETEGEKAFLRIPPGWRWV
jgi:sporulation protein YlmC with PRC-barrel domain